MFTHCFSMGYLHPLSLRERSCSVEGAGRGKLFSISCKLLVQVVFLSFLFFFPEHHPSSVLITELMISSWDFYGFHYDGFAAWKTLMKLSFICLVRNCVVFFFLNWSTRRSVKAGCFWSYVCLTDVASNTICLWPNFSNCFLPVFRECVLRVF